MQNQGKDKKEDVRVFATITYVCNRYYKTPLPTPTLQVLHFHFLLGKTDADCTHLDLAALPPAGFCMQPMSAGSESTNARCHPQKGIREGADILAAFQL